MLKNTMNIEKKIITKTKKEKRDIIV